MSTNIGLIEGKVEKYTGEGIVKYDDVKLSVNSFYGGKERGKSIQLTISGNHDYIQLSNENAKKLLKILQNSLLTK